MQTLSLFPLNKLTDAFGRVMIPEMHFFYISNNSCTPNRSLTKHAYCISSKKFNERSIGRSFRACEHLIRLFHNLGLGERDFLDEPETAPCPDEVGNGEDVSVPSSSVAEDMRRRIAMKQC